MPTTDDPFFDLMVTNASFKNPTSRDLYGGRTFGSATTFKCHVTYTQKNVMKPDGTTVVVDGTVKMNGVYSVQQGAQIVFSDNSTAEVIMVKQWYDEIGQHHTTLDFSGN